MLHILKHSVIEWLGIENVSLINGNYYANVSLPIDDGLISKIMSYGSGIKVNSPKELKQKIKEKANQVVSLYN